MMMMMTRGQSTVSVHVFTFAVLLQKLEIFISIQQSFLQLYNMWTWSRGQETSPISPALIIIVHAMCLCSLWWDSLSLSNWPPENRLIMFLLLSFTGEHYNFPAFLWAQPVQILPDRQGRGFQNQISWPVDWTLIMPPESHSPTATGSPADIRIRLLSFLFESCVAGSSDHAPFNVLRLDH